MTAENTVGVTAVLVAPALENARPVGDYIDALVEATPPVPAPATADEWIDAVKAAGLQLSITYDAYSGTPLHFSISPGSRGFGAAGWHRLKPLVDAIGQEAILAALQRRAVGDPLLELVKRARAYEASCAGNLHDDDDPRLAGFDRINAELKDAPVATTLEGVLAALEYGAAEVADFDLCGDGALRGAIQGFRNLLGVWDDVDPVFALIERHKALWPAVDEMDSDDGDSPEWNAAVNEAATAMDALVGTAPTTFAGAAAMTDYILAHPARRGDYQIDGILVETLGRALKALVP